MSEMQSMKSATEDGLQQLSKDLYSMVIQDQARILAEQNERWSQQRRILRDELSSPDYFHDQEHSLAILRDSSSGDWIANEATFKSWSNRSSTQSPLIFLNGIPGAGTIATPKPLNTSLIIFQVKPLWCQGLWTIFYG
jgi:hypothetical protein